MKESRSSKIIIYVIAVVIFIGLFFFTFRSKTDGLARRQVQMVAFGDSLFGLARDETSIPAQVGELMGMTVFNGAFGGTSVGRINDGRLDNAKGSVSLVGLAKAIAAEDFGVQHSMKMRESSTEYFEDTLDELEHIDFSTVELVLIMHGLNDYYSGIPIRNEEDSFDEYTFVGAFRSALEYLRQTNPTMRIVLVTSTYTWLQSTGQTCEEYNVGNGVQEDYVCAEIELAEELGVEVIDVYHGVYPHEEWEDWKLYTMDGLHPNEAGRELLANIIAGYLK